MQVSAKISVISFDEDEPPPLGPDGIEWPDLLSKKKPKLPGYGESGYADRALMRHLYGEGMVMNLSTDMDPDELARQLAGSVNDATREAREAEAAEARRLAAEAEEARLKAEAEAAARRCGGPPYPTGCTGDRPSLRRQAPCLAPFQHLNAAVLLRRKTHMVAAASWSKCNMPLLHQVAMPCQHRIKSRTATDGTAVLTQTQGGGGAFAC